MAGLSAATKRALQGSESAFLEQVVALAHATGWLVHHDRPAVDRSGRWASHIQGDAGFPDLVLAKGGRVLFWELKVGKGHLSQAQGLWAWELEEVACQTQGKVQHRMLTPDDWDYIEQTLKGE